MTSTHIPAVSPAMVTYAGILPPDFKESDFTGVKVAKTNCGSPPRGNDDGSLLRRWFR